MLLPPPYECVGLPELRGFCRIQLPYMYTYSLACSDTLLFATCARGESEFSACVFVNIMVFTLFKALHSSRVDHVMYM